jgi:hypothetical protein
VSVAAPFDNNWATLRRHLKNTAAAESVEMVNPPRGAASIAGDGRQAKKSRSPRHQGRSDLFFWLAAETA